MKNTHMSTKKSITDRKKAMLEQINYDPARTAEAWTAIAGIWESRVDIDATTVRKEAWLNRE